MSQDSPNQFLLQQLIQAMSARWIQEAQAKSLDLSDFDPQSPLETRLAWAKARELGIGCIYARASMTNQDSIVSQVTGCAVAACQAGVFVPDEYLIYEQQPDKGVRSERRLAAMLHDRGAGCLIVPDVARLFRSVFAGVKFFLRASGEHKVRCLSVKPALDTNDSQKMTWLYFVLEAASDLKKFFSGRG